MHCFQGKKFLKNLFSSLAICFAGLSFSFFSHVEARLSADSSVTYSLSGGRFGDNLLAVAHAKWLSYVLDVPLRYHPFPYSDHLQLNQDPSVLKTPPPLSHKHITLQTKEDYFFVLHQLQNLETELSALITLPYYPDTEHDLNIYPYYPLFLEVNWSDPQFIKELRALISPIEPLRKIELPHDRTTVAMHIRTGGGFDDSTLSRKFPLKSPPLSYYEESLRYLWTIVKKPLYVFLFTDDPSPLFLQHHFENMFAHYDIVFACREQGNWHNTHVLEDFFAFSSFDCIICSGSCFSLMASRLFHFDLLFAPLDFKREPNYTITINRILMEKASPIPNIPSIKTIIRR